MSIYHEYDIRGVYPTDINESKVYKIGKAFVRLLKSRTVIVAADMRLSSPSLKRALINGIVDMGIDVIDIGLCSTPMLYYATRYHDGIMITASHNPKEYNGLKLCRKGCRVMGKDEGISKIQKLVEKNNFKRLFRRKGKVTRRDMKKEYVDFILKTKKSNQRKLKVVVDAGSGISGIFAPRVFKRFPIKLIPMYFRLDGHFPHHVPNPANDKNMRALQKRVKKTKADLGIAFDGDADRIRFVDDKGRAISPDTTLALFAEYLIKQDKEKQKRASNKTRKTNRLTFVKGITCASAIDDAIKGKGKLVYSRVGHTNIAKAMRKSKAILGGERSGHFYFKDNKYCDNAMLAAVLMFNLLSGSAKKLSELVRPHIKFSKQINLRIKDKKKVINKVKSKFKKNKKFLIDGVSIFFKDWWFNLRESHTEPILRLTVESDSKKVLDEKIKKLKKIIKD